MRQRTAVPSAVRTAESGGRGKAEKEAKAEPTAKAQRARKAVKVAKVRKVRAAATRKPGRKTARRATRKATRKAVKARPPKEHPRFVKVRELDPFAMCGPGTSVARLFRVDERVNGSAATHLVFYDRHGWYCEHGKTCPAVHDARKLR